MGYTRPAPFRLSPLRPKAIACLAGLVSGLVTAALAATALKVDPLEVEVTPPTIERRIFDPKKPPADLPELKPPEAAFCGYEYSCEVGVQVEGQRVLLRQKPAKATALKVTTHLHITIWLPVNFTPKLEAHEQAHAALCQEFYRHAGEIARRLGGQVIGVTFKNSFKDEKALRGEMDTLQHDFTNAWLTQIGGPCARVQQYFDSITAHALNNLPETEAIAQSLAQSPEFGPVANKL